MSEVDQTSEGVSEADRRRLLYFTFVGGRKSVAGVWFEADRTQSEL